MEFAGDYDSLSDRERGWIKKSIAQHFQRLRGGSSFTTALRQSFPQGFWVEERVQPRDFALLLFDGRLRSISSLVAASMIPVAVGIPRCEVVFRAAGGEVWPRGFLAALELAGIENVSVQPVESGLELVRFGSTSQGSILSFGQIHRPQDVPAFSERIQAMVLEPEYTLGVWLGDEPQWDFEGIDFVHAGAKITFFAPPEKDLPVGRHAVRVTLDAFFEQALDAVCVPQRLANRSLEFFPRVFCPGQECLWCWPGIHTSQFLKRAVSWGELGNP